VTDITSRIFLRIKMPALFLAMLALPALAAAAMWPRHGLRGEYGVVVKGETLPCATIVDTDLYFVKRQLFGAPVYERWSIARFGDNTAIPVIETTWRGWLRVPSAGDYWLRQENNGVFSLAIDSQNWQFPQRGSSVGPIALEAGYHYFQGIYRGDNGPQFAWREDGGGYRGVAPAYFYQARPRLPLAKTLAALAVVAGLFFETALLARRRPATSEALLQFVSGRRCEIALALLLLITLATRAWRYDRMPFANETADEYDAMLNGLNLVYRGVPSGWSQLPAYRTAEIKANRKIFGENFTIVEPFFDHTPGLSLVTGSLLRALGVSYRERYDRYFVRETRPIPIALSVLTALLIYFLAARAIGRRDLALLAVAFYALYPTAALSGRLLKDENVLTPLFVAAILFAARYLGTRSRAALAGAALTAGVSCVFKATGVAVVGATIAVLLLDRRWKASAIVAGVGAVFFSSYFVFGAICGWDTFVRVFQNLQTRQYAVQMLPALSTRGLWTLVTDIGAATARFGALTYVWLWWCAILFWRHMSQTGEAAQPRAGLVVWPLMIMLVFMGISISSDKSFGWYRIPMMPFLVIAAAWCVGRMLSEGDVMLTACFCLLPLVDAAYWSVFAPATEHAGAYKLLNLAPFGLLFLSHLLPPDQRKNAVRALGVAALAVTLAFMAVGVMMHWYNYNLEY